MSDNSSVTHSPNDRQYRSMISRCPLQFRIMAGATDVAAHCTQPHDQSPVPISNDANDSRDNPEGTHSRARPFLSFDRFPCIFFLCALFPSVLPFFCPPMPHISNSSEGMAKEQFNCWVDVRSPFPLPPHIILDNITTVSSTDFWP